MEYSGWLSAIPEGVKKSRRELFGGEPRMPHVSMDYMLSYCNELGPVISTGEGHRPVGYSDIYYWGKTTGVKLSSWEVETLVAMSKTFLQSMLKSKDPNTPNPTEKHGR